MGGEVGRVRPETARLRQDGGNDAVWRPLQEIPDHRSANTEAQHHELANAQVVHQADLVVRVRIPRPVHLERPGRLAFNGVAQVRRDTAVLSLELLDGIEGRALDQVRDRRVQSSAGDQQQGEARAGLVIADAYL